ncbi:MAG: TetR/AcrR family transcriptional regulator [Magnetovibrio sp.]|nr:TetR/AcrR family transcriptional regulator [Magnetovibrio sp.]
MTKPKPSNDEILDIATRTFSEKGYDGARMAEIAKAAGVNKATLYYRIGDKDILFTAVLKRIFGTKVGQLEEMLKTPQSAEAKIHEFAKILVLGEIPEQFGAIMLREIANGGRNLPDEVLPLMGRTVGVLEEILASGQKDGVFKPINPFLLHMALVGGCSLYATNGPIRRRVAQMAPKDSAIHKELPLNEAANHIAEMLLGGIRITRN